MALKSKITDKAEFDKLADVIKAEYAEENGVWLLQSDDAAELRAAKEREKKRADDLDAENKRIKDAQAAADKKAKEAEDKARDDAARAAGDIEALERSYQSKVDEARAEGKAENKRLTDMLNTLLVENEAITLANAISTAPDLIMPHILKRMRAELTGDKPITRVLDAEGKPSAMNIEDLKKEFVANPKFAAIIKAGMGSGGGAGGNHEGGGAAKKITEMSEAEKVAHHKAVGSDAFRAQARNEGIAGY